MNKYTNHYSALITKYETAGALALIEHGEDYKIMSELAVQVRYEELMQLKASAVTEQFKAHRCAITAATSKADKAMAVAKAEYSMIMPSTADEVTRTETKMMLRNISFIAMSLTDSADTYQRTSGYIKEALDSATLGYSWSYRFAEYGATCTAAQYQFCMLWDLLDKIVNDAAGITVDSMAVHVAWMHSLLEDALRTGSQSWNQSNASPDNVRAMCSMQRSLIEMCERFQSRIDSTAEIVSAVDKAAEKRAAAIIEMLAARK